MGLLFEFHQNYANEKRLRRDLREETKTEIVNIKSIIWQVEANDDLLFEVFKHLDAKSLACASCVSGRWRKAAEEDTLWEGICTQNWPAASSHPQQLKSVVLALGGFRRLYVLCLRPLLMRPYPSSPCSSLCSSLAPVDHDGLRQWSKDEVHLSLSLFSIDCYERLGKRTCTPSLDILCKASSWQVVSELKQGGLAIQLPL